MDYKLFTDFITLQALLKDMGIIQSGGAVKSFLHENQVFLNSELEARRGKKLYLGDILQIPGLAIEIRLVEPSQEEKEEYLEDQVEKARVNKLVKEYNKQAKVKLSTNKNTKKPVRFPGR